MHEQTKLRLFALVVIIAFIGGAYLMMKSGEAKGSNNSPYYQYKAYYQPR